MYHSNRVICGQQLYKIVIISFLFVSLIYFYYSGSPVNTENTSKFDSKREYLESEIMAQRSSVTEVNIYTPIETTDKSTNYFENKDTHEGYSETLNSSLSKILKNPEQGTHMNESCAAQRKLLGPLTVNLTTAPLGTIITELEQKWPFLQLGGCFAPNCVGAEQVALLVPYRDREFNLVNLLNNLHPILQRQKIAYQMFIIEQVGTEIFNKGILFNAGFKEALKTRNFSCFIFHDVDLIPEDDMNLYTCLNPRAPVHMSVAVDIMEYKLPFETIFGGVTALTREQYETTNGFSNRFWGWGGEDDDMRNRVTFNGFKISRPSATVARYKMLDHNHNIPHNEQRWALLKEKVKHYNTDGLSSVQYTIEEITQNRLYTLIKVQPPPKNIENEPQTTKQNRRVTGQGSSHSITVNLNLKMLIFTFSIPILAFVN